MNPKHPGEQHIGRVIQRRSCAIALLVAAIAILLSFGEAGTVQANSANVAYVTDTSDIDVACDGVHAPSGSHCCAGVACAGYAHHESVTTPSIVTGDGTSLPAIQVDRASRTLRPAPQPPRT